MSRVRPAPLPAGAFLDTYRARGHFTDCYVTDIAGPVSLGQFLSAFYATPVFRLERWILGHLAGQPSTAEDLARLADARSEKFAAWNVEQRAGDQVLLADFRGRTRSWLMVGPRPGTHEPSTRLYFGSAVLSPGGGAQGQNRLPFSCRALLRFHALYSRVLLSSARRALLVRHES